MCKTVQFVMDRAATGRRRESASPRLESAKRREACRAPMDLAGHQRAEGVMSNALSPSYWAANFSNSVKQSPKVLSTESRRQSAAGATT